MAKVTLCGKVLFGDYDVLEIMVGGRPTLQLELTINKQHKRKADYRIRPHIYGGWKAFWVNDPENFTLVDNIMIK